MSRRPPINNCVQLPVRPFFWGNPPVLAVISSRQDTSCIRHSRSGWGISLCYLGLFESKALHPQCAKALAPKRKKSCFTFAGRMQSSCPVHKAEPSEPGLSRSCQAASPSKTRQSGNGPIWKIFHKFQRAAFDALSPLAVRLFEVSHLQRLA